MIDPTLSAHVFRRRPAYDGIYHTVHLQKRHVIALAIRNALLFALIFHAITTVLFSPRGDR